MARPRWHEPFLWMFSLGDLVLIAWWVLTTPRHLQFRSEDDR
jgi:hypothetical protein